MRVLGLTKIFIVSAVMVIYASGCATDPYTGESKMSNTAKGALIGVGAGAALGAVTGKNTKDRQQRALKGAAIGGLIGGGTGAYMDKQESELRKQLQGTGVSVTRTGDNITLNMPGNITFRSGNADLQPHFYDVLNSVGLVLKKYNKTNVEVSGHTDSVGSDAKNLTLSQNRATAVAQYLMGRGLTQARTSVVGYGETRPVAGNDNEDGRASNRRVEILLLPIEGQQ
jgi:outer membrane protein OmpA-like peptidoglycan-associated protein